MKYSVNAIALLLVRLNLFAQKSVLKANNCKGFTVLPYKNLTKGEIVGIANIQVGF